MSLSKKDKINKVNNFDKIIMFLLVGIVPIMIYGVIYNSPYIDASGNPVPMFDYFNYVKVLLIKIIAVLILLYEIMDFCTSDRIMMFRYEYKEKFTLKYAFCGLIVLGTIIAFIFSDYKYLALSGARERFESIWVHFSYIIIFIYSLKFFKKDGAFKVFSYGILFSTFVFGLIGVLQATPFDPYKNETFLRMTIQKSVQKLPEITMQGSFSTMYNTNTSASYATFILFVLCIIFLLIDDLKVKIMVVVDIILNSTTMFFSYSQSAFFALFVGICSFVVIFGLYSFKKGSKHLAIGIFSVIGVSVVILIGCMIGTAKGKEFTAKINNSDSEFTDWKQEGDSFYFYNPDDDFIKFANLSGDVIEIYENDVLIDTIEKKWLSENLLETNDNYKLSSAKYVPTEKFNDLRLLVYKLSGNSKYYLRFRDYFYIEWSDEPKILELFTENELNHYNFIGFEKHNRFASHRGYIWSRTLPLVFKRPIGYGSDSFIDVFPNQDLVVRDFVGFDKYLGIDKPHSIYLNMLSNNGLLYLVGFLGIVILTLSEKLKLLFNKDGIKTHFIALIIFISGCVAYLINGLATDNTVIIILIFWIYLSVDNKIFICEKSELE